ncbi:MAG: protein translocase subunit SecD, partial [Ilumatobacteraceae bacterium]
CVTSDPKSTPATTGTTPTGTTPTGTVGTSGGSSTTLASAATVAPTTTAAGGPSRLPSTANTAPTTTAPASTTTTASGSTTTVAGTNTTTPGATPTTVAGNTSNSIPDVPPDQPGFLPARGGSVCYVGPAGGTGEVFQDDATARILSGEGWGVTVSLRSGAGGEDVWNSIASECFNATASCPTRQLAIVLDGEVISAPTVQQAQFSGSVQITGSFKEAEARNLARVLNSGSLPVKLETQAVQTVSPTLGKDSLRAAWIAGVVGIGLVFIFMLLYYRLLGLIVAAGLAVSGALIWTVISFLSKTQGLALSLAGIAGLIVSVGVTVDSYVVFFERLKDEVRAGRSMRNSAQRGFAGAWHTIVVADMVSLIGAGVLWYLTVGSVRGFAFFLGLSTLCDLLVAYCFTRPAVLLLARTEWMSRRKVMGIEVSSAGASS